MPKKTTIVLADEQTLFREGLAVICESTREFRVAGHCGDGRSAVKMIEALAPDIAILDLGLPKLYTQAAIRKLRQGQRCPQILVLSMRRDREAVLDVLRSGANGYLLKNDPASCLLEGLRTIAAGSIYVSPQFKLAEIFDRSWQVPARKSFEQLPAREHQVFMLLVQGLSGKDIADRLELSQKTVSTYRANLMSRLGISDLPGLVRYALRKKLISLG